MYIHINTGKGILVFGILMVMLFALMRKTNLYYQNPVLTIYKKTENI